jgi:hypothetical protein
MCLLVNRCHVQKPWNMNSIVRRAGAMGLSLSCLIYPQISLADGFTGKEFATWETASQDSYIQTSVTMAGVVLSQLQPEKSACIDDWYLGDGQKNDRNTYIRETVSKFGEYHPSGTILAILIEACGSFQ